MPSTLSPSHCRSTARRCRDEHLEEALQLAQALGRELQALGEAEVRPLLRCVLAFQLEAAGSSSAFQKLEQVRNASLRAILRVLLGLSGGLSADCDPAGRGPGGCAGAGGGHAAGWAGTARRGENSWHGGATVPPVHCLWGHCARELVTGALEAILPRELCGV